MLSLLWLMIQNDVNNHGKNIKCTLYHLDYLQTITEPMYKFTDDHTGNKAV